MSRLTLRLALDAPRRRFGTGPDRGPRLTSQGLEMIMASAQTMAREAIAEGQASAAPPMRPTHAARENAGATPARAQTAELEDTWNAR